MPLSFVLEGGNPPSMKLYQKGEQNMKPFVQGITTDPNRIAKMLGVKNESEYGLYQETKMGRYYAKFLPDGTFDNQLVRLISHEQAANLESSACEAIQKAGENLQRIIATTPKIDWDKFSKDMQQSVQALVEESTEPMRKASENLQKIIAATPTIDKDKLEEDMKAVASRAEECAEQMRKDSKRILEAAGFHPIYNDD